jgi:Leucine-rich repeat (LRR) protein
LRELYLQNSTKDNVESWLNAKVQSNEIVDIPPEIANLASLRIFDLSYNLISVLPSEIGKLTGSRNCNKKSLFFSVTIIKIELQ